MLGPLPGLHRYEKAGLLENGNSDDASHFAPAACDMFFYKRDGSPSQRSCTFFPHVSLKRLLWTDYAEEAEAEWSASILQCSDSTLNALPK